MLSIIRRSLAVALFTGLALAAAGTAQPPGQTKGPPKGFAPLSPLGVEDVLARIMAFDKNKDGKITRDELPDRMQHLFEPGDTNKDGALDRDEIRKLAARQPAGGDVGFGAGPVRIGAGPGPGPRGGFGIQIADAIQGGPDVVAGVVDDMKLAGAKRDQAMAAAKAHHENVRRLMDQARAELLETMRGILSAQEFKDFQAALDRPRGASFFNVNPRVGPKGGGLQKVAPP
jgi:hypothetical protein